MEFSGNIGHLTDIESPWGNAGGVVKTVEDVARMARTGVGWIEAGSYTLEPRIGNAPNGETVYYHDAAAGATYNSLGMPNQGIDVLEAQLPDMLTLAHKHGKKLVVNVAPVSENPAMESLELVSRAYAAGADSVLLNAGCPNVVEEDGGRHELLSRNWRALGEVLFTLAEAGVEKPVFVRTSPRIDTEAGKRMHMVIKQSGVVSAVFLPNTWPGHVPKDESGKDILEVPGGAGGMSGPITAENSRLEVAGAWQMLRRSNIDVVSSSGIVDAAELRIRMYAGAVAGAGTTFFYESESWQESTDKMLSELAA